MDIARAIWPLCICRTTVLVRRLPTLLKQTAYAIGHCVDYLVILVQGRVIENPHIHICGRVAGLFE